MDEKEIPFFNYTSKIGYLFGMTDKKQESRLQEKMQAFHLMDSKIQASIATIWEPNKPARLHFFCMAGCIGWALHWEPCGTHGLPGKLYLLP